MTPEERARETIDELLLYAGWSVQDRAEMNLFDPAHPGVTVREVHLATSHTLKQSPLTRSDPDEFVTCYNPANRHERQPTWSEETVDGRFRPYTYGQILARDKINLDIFWLLDESLEDTNNLPDPDIIAAEIVEDLEAALEQFRLIAEDLGNKM
jgi:hypothetical protein